MNLKRKKPNPSIIRRGDIVQINNPEMFIRCGYPLSLKKMSEEVGLAFGDTIRDLIQSAIGKAHGFDQATYDFVIQKLAYLRLKEMGFGGEERKIYTEKNELLKGVRARVVDIFFVKTGLRSPGYRDYDYYSGGYDAEPPYLADQKTHKILRINILQESSEQIRSLSDGNRRIEAINVTKIIEGIG